MQSIPTVRSMSLEFQSCEKFLQKTFSLILSYSTVLHSELPLRPTGRLRLYLAHSFLIFHFKMRSYLPHLTKVLAQAVIIMHLSYCSIVPPRLDDCKVFRLMLLRKQLQRRFFWPLLWPYCSSFCVSAPSILLHQMLIIDPTFKAFIIYSHSIYHSSFSKYNLNTFQMLDANPGCNMDSMTCPLPSTQQ